MVCPYILLGYGYILLYGVDSYLFMISHAAPNVMPSTRTRDNSDLILLSSNQFPNVQSLFVQVAECERGSHIQSPLSLPVSNSLPRGTRGFNQTSYCLTCTVWWWDLYRSFTEMGVLVKVVEKTIAHCQLFFILRASEMAQWVKGLESLTA